MGNIWELVWTTFTIFAIIVYLFLLWGIISDLFRDPKLNGWFKVIWIIFLLCTPYLSAFVYLILRGKGMAERSQKAAKDQRAVLEEYIRDTAAIGASEEIARGKALLDAGALTSDEFVALKHKALAH